MSTTNDLDIAEAALNQIELDLGAGSVSRSEEVLVDFRDPYRALGAAHLGPVGVVMPTTVEEVQAIVKIAAEMGVPISTSSQARNYGYGGAEPRVAGAIALSLRKMNRVLEVNAELGYAVVEPGVTFFDLYDAVQKSGHRLWISCPDLGWGSVIGNALEHGLGYTPMGDHPSALCGMEVVLANGDVVRTGMGGIPDSANWHTHKRGFGPAVDGLFTQSNLGIVTRVGVWLMPEPEVYSPGTIIVPNEEDLIGLVDTLRPLMMDGTIQGYPMIVHGLGPLVIAVPKPMWPPLTGMGTQAELQPVLDQMGLGMWITRLALYGRREVVEANRRYIEAAFAPIQGARVEFREYSAPYSRENVALPDQVPAGIPNMEVLRFLDAFGGADLGGHLDFSPVSPMTGRDALAVFRALWEHFARHNIQAVYSPIFRDRSLVHVNMIGFNRSMPAEVANAAETVRGLVDAMDSLGYGEYRSHQDFADLVAGKYTYDEGSLPRLYRTLKDALDPQGILSPGRQGVWASEKAIEVGL